MLVKWLISYLMWFEQETWFLIEILYFVFTCCCLFEQTMKKQLNLIRFFQIIKICYILFLNLIFRLKKSKKKTHIKLINLFYAVARDEKAASLSSLWFFKWISNNFVCWSLRKELECYNITISWFSCMLIFIILFYKYSKLKWEKIRKQKTR